MYPPNSDEISKNNAKNTKIVEIYPPNSAEISKNNAKNTKVFEIYNEFYLNYLFFVICRVLTPFSIKKLHLLFEHNALAII